VGRPGMPVTSGGMRGYPRLSLGIRGENPTNFRHGDNTRECTTKPWVTGGVGPPSLTGDPMTGTTLTTGTPVVYRGSITQCRGSATVLGPCECKSCDGLNRLVIITAGGELLQHVRAESVGELGWTPASEPLAC
jgi:hypothetical protein